MFINKLKFYLFYLIPYVLIGQNTYTPIIITHKDGLPSKNVFQTLKKDNLLYIATHKGIVVYDGYRIVKNDSITRSNYLISNKNKLYFFEHIFGIKSIKNIYDSPKNIINVNFNDSILENNLYANLYLDQRNYLWCNDFSNVKYINLNNKKIKSFNLDNQNKNQEFKNSCIEISNDKMFICNFKGLFIYNSTSDTLSKIDSHKIANLNYNNGIKIKNNVFFITNSGLLVNYNIKNNSYSIDNHFLNENNTYFNVSNFQDKLLVWDKNNLYVYDSNKKEKQLIYTTENEINHVYFDETTRLIWVSTNNGLVKLIPNDNGIINIFLPTKDNIVSICKDKNHTLWMADKSNMVYKKLINNKIETIKLNKNIVCNNLYYHQNIVFIATNTGVFIIENNIPKQVIFSNYSVDEIIIDKKNRLWVMNKKYSIRVFNANTFKEETNYVKNTTNYWIENESHDLFEDFQGKIWLASWMPKDYGISYFDEKSQTFLGINQIDKNDNKKPFVTDYYNKVSQTIDNQLLFSGAGGWNRVDSNGKITYSFSIDQYKNVTNTIQSIFQDPNGCIWFLGDDGLYNFNFITKNITHITEVDGLINENLIYGFEKITDNIIAIGGKGYIQIIDLNKILKTNLIEKLELIEVLKDNKNIKFKNNTISIDYDFTKLDLSFSDLSFSNNEKKIYRYKFDNEKNWNYLGKESKLSLLKIPSGKYKISIEVGDNLGNWQTKQLIIFLKIAPPFYKTWWFLLLIGFLIISIILYINNYFAKKKLEKVLFQKKIKESEMQTLRSQMNPHFIFNSLNSINSFIIQNKTTIASEYLNTFSKLMRQILENSKQELISINSEIKTLKNYIQLEAARLDNKFDYQIQIDEDIDIDYYKIPPLILQPFIENAIWHGIHNKPTKGIITLTIKYIDDDTFQFIIQDDGIGRQKSALLKSNETKHKSYGIDITIERIKMINPQNTVEIIDLFKNNQAIGTQVIITLINV
jgi:ligand-binding sensor domain-containing protein